MQYKLYTVCKNSKIQLNKKFLFKTWLYNRRETEIRYSNTNKSRLNQIKNYHYSYKVLMESLQRSTQLNCLIPIVLRLSLNCPISSYYLLIPNIMSSLMV